MRETHTDPQRSPRRTCSNVCFGVGLSALAIVIVALGVGVNTVLFAVGLAASYLAPGEHSSDPIGE